MCHVIAFGALCAVFTPVQASADVPSPPAVTHARASAQPAPRLATIPAAEPAGRTAAVTLDVPGGRRGEWVAGEGAQGAAAPARTIRVAYGPRGDTEAKSSRDASGEAGGGESGDTEKK
jgi:hypothetical protein